ncbi:MAG: hypothetical protein AAGC95_12810 [Pseudomonadota bacterium]
MKTMKKYTLLYIPETRKTREGIAPPERSLSMDNERMPLACGPPLFKKVKI